jgi:hypothetical protein
MSQSMRPAPNLDMHNEVGLVDFSLPRGEVAYAEVVCHHSFGLGLYLLEHDAHAHVNRPEISDAVLRGVA